MTPAVGKDPPTAKPAEPARAAPDEAALRLKSLEEERDRLKAELNDVRDRFLRSRADYDNLARRSQKEALDVIRGAKAALLLRIVAIAETLDKAAADAERAGPGTAKGLKLVTEELRRLLKDEGVKEIDAAGQAFNFKYHQAVERIETSEHADGTIVEVVQRGYLLQGEILRPALVKVAVPARRAPTREATPPPAEPTKSN